MPDIWSEMADSFHGGLTMRVMRNVEQGMRPLARWLKNASRAQGVQLRRQSKQEATGAAKGRGRLLTVTRALLAPLTKAAPQRELLQASIEALLELLQVKYGAICVLGEDGSLQQFVHAGLSAEEAARIVQAPSGSGLLGAVIRDNSVIRLDDIARDQRSAGFPAHHPHMAKLLAVPVSYLDRVYGRIYLCDKLDGGAFDNDDEELALSFASALSLVLDNERRLVELEREQGMLVHSAFHDPLTNLPNRALLGDRIGQVLSKAHRSRTQAAVMFCDLDDFKAINDSLGHEAGDQVLQAVSERLVSCLREEDTVARIGGDEFVFVLSSVDSAEQAGIVAQKILDAVSHSIVVGECEIALSGSVGIALFPFDGDASEHLIRNADTAMYRAKESGKNSYRFFSEVRLESDARAPI